MTIYYFADETSQLNHEIPWKAVIMSALQSFRSVGRPISKLVFDISGNIATISFAGLQFIRVMQFTASFSTAVLLYYLLRKRKVPTIWAGILILFIWSQPVFQVYHVYAMLLPYFLGIIASYLAVAVLFWTQTTSKRRLLAAFVLAFFLLMAGWLTFQATPFAGLALVAFYALTVKGEAARGENKKLLLFIASLFLSMQIYTAGYWMVLRLFPTNTYRLTTYVFSLLSGEQTAYAYIKIFDPRGYLGIFEWWNYFVPLPVLGPVKYYLATGFSALGWLVIFSWSFLLELASRPRRPVLAKYLLATIAILLSLMPIVADGFTKRQHMYIAVAPTMILCLGYCLSVISRRYKLWEKHRRWITGVTLLLLLLVVLGAQANLNRGLVQPAARFYTFVRMEIIRHGNEPYDGILVINADNYCSNEPCTGFFGRRLGIAGRSSNGSSNFYRQTLNRLGKTADVPIEYARELDPAMETANKLIINHQILYRHLRR